MKFTDDDHRLDEIFAALAHPIRRAVVARLTEGASPSVTELAEPFDVSLMAVSKHLGRLERAGLVAREEDGRYRRCRLMPGPLAEAAAWLSLHAQFWGSSLDSLDDFLQEDG